MRGLLLWSFLILTRAWLRPTPTRRSSTALSAAPSWPDLLDRSVLIYSRSQHAWLADQASSLIQHVSKRMLALEASTAPSLPAVAREIEVALLAHTDPATMEPLIERYRSAKDHQLMVEIIEDEMAAMDDQLRAWEALLDSLQPAIGLIDPPNIEQPKALELASESEQPVLAGTTASNDTSSRMSTALRAMAVDTELETAVEAQVESEEVDIAIVGAGIAGLCAGAILNTLYGKKVGVYESHYLPGGCAHAFERKAKNGVEFTFDSGPTILLGCSSPPYNALRQVIDAIRAQVEWIPYDGWGMIENPGKASELRWRVELGPDRFEEGPLKAFGGPKALEEFKALQKATKGLLAGASIPAMAMRPGSSALVPLMRYFPTLVQLLSQGETTTGTFAPFVDGPLFTVTDPWLRNWLDALAFSLSGLPASRTAAAAMAFVLSDMHRPGAALDYPKGGMGEIIKALVCGVEQGNNGSKLHLRQHVESIDCSSDAQRITGLSIRGGKKVVARLGVICNAPVWTLRTLIKDLRVLERLNNKLPLESTTTRSSWTATEEGATITLERDPVDAVTSFLGSCDKAEQTGSFLHLHLALDARDLDIDALEAHYTVMDRGLSGDGSVKKGVEDGPCGELNMIAVSNPCKLDRTLAPNGYIVVHAYGAGNEPYEIWENLSRSSKEYNNLKEQRAQVLWRAVESVIPDARYRAVLELIGSPITHERFLRRPRGTYGSATEDYLRDGSTPYDSLLLANDGVFPGIGVPSVAICGASAANAFVSVLKQWQCLDSLKKKNKI